MCIRGGGRFVSQSQRKVAQNIPEQYFAEKGQLTDSFAECRCESVEKYPDAFLQDESHNIVRQDANTRHVFVSALVHACRD